MTTIRDLGFNAGAHDASHTDSTPCPYPVGSWQEIEWKDGYAAGTEHFHFAYPEA
jgi:hypothetical protein